MTGIGWEEGGSICEQFALPGKGIRGSVADTVEDFGGHLGGVSGRIRATRFPLKSWRCIALEKSSGRVECVVRRAYQCPCMLRYKSLIIVAAESRVTHRRKRHFDPPSCRLFALELRNLSLERLS